MSPDGSSTPDALLERARDDRAALLAEPSTLCLNCGAVLPGSFCPHCGQKSRSIRQPVHEFARETFVEFFGLDGRLWRSLGLLLVRPGALTVEFIEGKRMRSLTPLKLYLTSTLLFFVTLGLVESDEPVPEVLDDSSISMPPYLPDTTVEASDAADALDLWALATAEQRRGLMVATAVLTDLDSSTARRAARAADSLREVSRRFGRARDSVRALPADTLLLARDLGLTAPAGADSSGESADEVDLDLGRSGAAQLAHGLPDWLKGDVARRLEQARTPAERDAAQQAALDALVGQIPTAMFFVLPVFALLLKGLYAGGGGIELRGRRTSAPPAEALPGAPWPDRLRAAARRLWWRTRLAARRRQVRRRVRIARRPWRRAIRTFRSRLPERVRLGRVAWLRRAATARRTRYYAEHVVFTLHVHAFAFVVFWALLLVGDRGVNGTVSGWLVFAIPVYFLLAQRRVYAQTWGKTLVKSALLGAAYSVVLAIGTVIAGALAARLG